MKEKMLCFDDNIRAIYGYQFLLNNPNLLVLVFLLFFKRKGENPLINFLMKKKPHVLSDFKDLISNHTIRF